MNDCSPVRIGRRQSEIYVMTVIGCFHLSAPRLFRSIAFPRIFGYCAKMPLAQCQDIRTEEYMGDRRYSTKKTYKANIENRLNLPWARWSRSGWCRIRSKSLIMDRWQMGGRVPREIRPGGSSKRTRQSSRKRFLCPSKTVRSVQGTLTKALSTAVSIGYLRTGPAAA